MTALRHPIMAGVFLACFGPSVSWGAEVDVDPNHVLDTLAPEHPRLMLTDNALQDLKKRAETRL